MFDLKLNKIYTNINRKNEQIIYEIQIRRNTLQHMREMLDEGQIISQKDICFFAKILLKGWFIWR